jgi:hypothetical protein
MCIWEVRIWYHWFKFGIGLKVRKRLCWFNWKQKRGNKSCFLCVKLPENRLLFILAIILVGELVVQVPSHQKYSPQTTHKGLPPDLMRFSDNKCCRNNIWTVISSRLLLQTVWCRLHIRSQTISKLPQAP